jgi:hypothetical protein
MRCNRASSVAFRFTPKLRELNLKVAIGTRYSGEEKIYGSTVLTWSSRRGYNLESFAGAERNIVAVDEWSRTACRVYINMQSGR